MYLFIFLSAVSVVVRRHVPDRRTAALSPRVKRDLPQTLLGRIFLTWFAPGPGTGYMFAVEP